ncbi:hypothetical protein B0T26DRAFT_110949 [Lasiosphaeria miniovina]|uniref:Uncharacterized protein n=1 Tax=Lasiosphaeria miniovina TaxID=1954250 RepID=A0AA40E6M2_9PEZI|nr:uncharacterized protein B0T26DRAFT_110949 [Lasiosphaeria miniovina]KAK0726982.1 hypothetical protein B0T26DRAFT_110949 [Lasiosphaeria miniovina]
MHTNNSTSSLSNLGALFPSRASHHHLVASPGQGTFVTLQYDVTTFLLPPPWSPPAGDPTMPPKRAWWLAANTRFSSFQSLEAFGLARQPFAIFFPLQPRLLSLSQDIREVAVPNQRLATATLNKGQLVKRDRGTGYLLWPAVISFSFQTRLESLELVTTKADAPPLLFGLDSATDAIANFGDNLIDAQDRQAYRRYGGGGRYCLWGRCGVER